MDMANAPKPDIFGRDPTPLVLGAPDHSGAITDAHIDAARARGVHVMRVDASDDRSVITVAAYRDNAGKDAPLIALTDANTSLSQVRQLKRAGVSEVVPDTTPADEFDELVAELCGRSLGAETARQKDRGQVIAVARSRGGVGATTVAVNLADAMLDRRGAFKKAVNKRVALVDLDMQMGDVASFLDLEPNDALYDLAMTGEDPDATFLQQAMVTLPSGMSVLTAPSRFAPMDALKSRQIAKIIEELRETHDFVVLDLPCGLVEWLDPVLKMADRLLLVTDCAVPSIRQSRRLMDFFAESNIALKLELVVNHEAKPMVMRGHHKAAQKVLKQTFQHWIPDEPQAARSALDRGAPLSAVAPRARMSKAIARLTKDLVTSLGALDTAAASKAN